MKRISTFSIHSRLKSIFQHEKKTSKKSANHFMNVDYMKEDFFHKFSAYFSILNKKIVTYVLTAKKKKRKEKKKYDTF